MKKLKKEEPHNMHKNLCWLLVTSYWLLLLSGCVSMPKPIAKIIHPSGAGVLGLYSGPKAGLVIADFEIRDALLTPDVALGLREMLLGTFINSNRFLMLEPKTTDLMLMIAVTEFQPQASGGRAGIGGGGGVDSGTLGGLMGATLNMAHIALEVRIVSAATSKVLATGKVKGQASDVSGALLTQTQEVVPLDARLAIYTNTPMEKAIRICVFEALRFIVGNTPGKYYKY